MTQNHHRDTEDSTSQAPVAPVAAKIEHLREHHGDSVNDPYEWLRDKNDPKVIAHLEAENAYTEAVTSHLAELSEKVFTEIKTRTQETDLSVPVRHGDSWYYSRTVQGQQYAIHARTARSAGSVTAAGPAVPRVSRRGAALLRPSRGATGTTVRRAPGRTVDLGARCRGAPTPGKAPSTPIPHVPRTDASSPPGLGAMLRVAPGRRSGATPSTLPTGEAGPPTDTGGAPAAALVEEAPPLPLPPGSSPPLPAAAPAASLSPPPPPSAAPEAAPLADRSAEMPPDPLEPPASS